MRGQAAEFESWLRKQLADHVPYDQLVRALLTLPFGTNRGQVRNQVLPPEQPTPRAFYLAKDVKPENLAASTARLFLGIRLECAQCHHHPHARWQREQFWGFAAFFAGLQRQNQEGSPDIIREVFDRRELTIPGGSQVVPAAFLDGTEPQWRFRTGARVTLADWMTSRDNPYFARAAVNRLWGYFFGTGFVEPVDDLDSESTPSHPALLDELAQAFAGSGFDLQFLIRAITSTRTYQQASIAAHPSQEDPRQFARMAVRGLTPEQVYDSIVQATGYREPPPPANEDEPQREGRSPFRAEFLARFPSNQGEKATEAQTSMLQALMLMNGRFMAQLTSLQGDGTLATIARDASLDTAGRIEALYLATLSRPPSARERTGLLKYIASRDSGSNAHQALADVFWALLNSGEFTLNH